MAVLGIDPGWDNVGWSTVVEGGVEVLCLRPYNKVNVCEGANVLAAWLRLTMGDFRVICLEQQYGSLRYTLLQRYMVSAFKRHFPNAIVKMVNANSITAHYGYRHKYPGLPHKTAARLTAEGMGLAPGRTQHEVDAYLLAQYGRSKFLTPDPASPEPLLSVINEQ